MKLNHLAWMLVSFFLAATTFQLSAQQATTATNSFEEIKAKAEAGDADAQFRLGSLLSAMTILATTNIFEPMSPTNTNLLEAVKWYRKAAEQGNVEAEDKLGDCYQYGSGVDKDMVEAVKWYSKAAKQDSIEAQFALALCSEAGDGMDKDFVQAYKWFYLVAAHVDDTNKTFGLPSWSAQARSDLKILADKLTPEEIEQAKQLVGKEAPNAVAKVEADLAADAHKQFETDKSKAEMENAWPWDQNSLAFDYQQGKGVAKDEVEAAKWFLKAAEQGYISAQTSLGLCYEDGDGVFKDDVEAAKWYRRAAIQGDKEGQRLLGFKYQLGHGVPLNYVEAYKWFSLAAAQGDSTSQSMRDVVAQQMNPEQIAEAQQLSGEFKPRKESSSDNSNLPENPTASGSGFFITDDGYLISNYHVVKDATKVRLVMSNGTIDAKVVQVDAANDLALLKADGKFSPLPIAASRSAHLGGTVATIGFPDPSLQGFSPKLAKGEIASLSGAGDDPRYFQISVPVQPGNSGGALVDDRGNVIGIVSAKLDAAVALAASGALPENVNYAVKSSLLLSFLESVPEVAAKLKELNTKDEKFSDVVKSAQDAAVLVLVY